MALPVWVTWLANIRGPQGPQGPPIDQAQLEAAVEAEVSEQLPPLLDAEIDSRNLVSQEKCIRLVSGRWFWDGPGVAASTHFVVRRDGRWATAAAPLPQPSASAPAITW